MTLSSMNLSTNRTQLSLCDGGLTDPHSLGQYTVYTERELRDNEVPDKMKDGLNKANVLTLEDLKAATIAGKIPTAITDSGASTTCVQPA